MMPQRGDRAFWQGDWAKVMTVCDGYIMARKKGCTPFVVSLKEWASCRQHPDNK